MLAWLAHDHAAAGLSFTGVFVVTVVAIPVPAVVRAGAVVAMTLAIIVSVPSPTAVVPFVRLLVAAATVGPGVGRRSVTALLYAGGEGARRPRQGRDGDGEKRPDAHLHDLIIAARA